MIPDRKITLPTSTKSYELFGEVDTKGRRAVYITSFYGLEFKVHGDKIGIYGHVRFQKILRLQRKPRWFVGEKKDSFCWIAEDSHWLLGRYYGVSTVQELVMSAGLENGIVLHRSFVQEALEGPMNELREIERRFAPEIFGQLRVSEESLRKVA